MRRNMKHQVTGKERPDTRSIGDGFAALEFPVQT
jgi:hypothetical protein